MTVERMMSPSAFNGCVAELVLAGLRAITSVTRSGEVELHVYRCGHEIEGPIAVRLGLGSLEAARAEAERLCEPAAQLDLFR